MKKKIAEPMPELMPKKGEAWPSWPPDVSTDHLMPRSKRQILTEIKESDEAQKALPSLRRKADAAEKLKAELAEWQRPFDAKKAAALDRAHAAVERINKAEAELARNMIATLESPMWRSARALVQIHAAREDMIKECREALAVDYDAALKAHAEDGSPASSARAKSYAMEAAGPGKLAQLVEETDPNFSPYRSLPEAGPSREIAKILEYLIFPEMRERQPLNVDRR